MNKTKYNKWALEVCNQEYEGKLFLLFSNIQKNHIINGEC